MREDILTQRKRWFGSFPEGCLEFLIATRSLALVLLLSLLVLREAQRPIIIAGLVGILWIDYVLTVWWAAQVAMDVALVAARRGRGMPGAPSRHDKPEARFLERQRAQRRISIQILLPSIAAAAALIPWPALLRLVYPGLIGSAVDVLLQWIGVIMGVVFIVLVVFAQRPLRTIGMKSVLWRVVLMVPLLHWFALHRFAVDLEHRMAACQRRPETEGEDIPSESTPSLSVALADAVWVIMMLPWVVFLAIVVVQGRWPSGAPGTLLPMCGILLAAVFAVADLAALERVQRHRVELLTKTPRADDSESEACD